MDILKQNNNRPRVGIDPRPIKTREMLDRNGNVIDPVTKQVIKLANQIEDNLIDNENKDASILHN